MKGIDDIRRENAETWAMVIEKLRGMGQWVVVEHGPGPVGNQSIVSVLAVPARDATAVATELSARVPAAHSIAILPPAREAVLTLGDYVRACEARYRYRSDIGGIA